MIPDEEILLIVDVHAAAAAALRQTSGETPRVSLRPPAREVEHRLAPLDRQSPRTVQIPCKHIA
jgi:hypothetical protein